MVRTVRKIDENTFEFSTPQEPRIEVHTIQQMQDYIENCNTDILGHAIKKLELQEKINEAEALG